MSTSDPEQTMFFSRPEGLARILALDDESTEVWNPEEMKAMWLHQLAAPLEADLGSMALPVGSPAPDFSAFSGKNFQDLLGYPDPPLDLLRLTKEFAKQVIKDSDDKQLKEIASVLYYSVYAAGLIRHGQSLGSLQGYHLVSGFGWALERTWLDDITRELISSALRHIAPPIKEKGAPN